LKLREFLNLLINKLNQAQISMVLICFCICDYCCSCYSNCGKKIF